MNIRSVLPGHKFRATVAATLAVGMSLSGLTISFPATVSADACTINGRDCFRGWFTNRAYTPYVGDGHMLFTPPSPPLGLFANNINDLTSMISGRLNCGAFNAGGHNTTGAAFIVLTMLGASPGTSKSTACSRLNEWTALVRSYDSAGLINYNIMYNSGNINTLYSTSLSDVTFYAEDVTTPSIVVYSPSRSPIYAIKRDCGNPINRLQRIPPLATNPPPAPPPVGPPAGPPAPPPAPPPYGDINPPA